MKRTRGETPLKVRLDLSPRPKGSWRRGWYLADAPYACTEFPDVEGEDGRHSVRVGAPMFLTGIPGEIACREHASEPLPVRVKSDDQWARMAQEHVHDLTSGRLPPEDVVSNIAEDLRRAADEKKHDAPA